MSNTTRESESDVLKTGRVSAIVWWLVRNQDAINSATIGSLRFDWGMDGVIKPQLTTHFKQFTPKR
jgi:hypothetical protein